MDMYALRIWVFRFLLLLFSVLFIIGSIKYFGAIYGDLMSSEWYCYHSATKAGMYLFYSSICFLASFGLVFKKFKNSKKFIVGVGLSFIFLILMASCVADLLSELKLGGSHGEHPTTQCRHWVTGQVGSLGGVRPPSNKNYALLRI